MNNNDVLRRLRYVFDYNDEKMIEICAHAGGEVNRSYISSWLKPDDDPGFLDISDKEFAIFLSGFIIENRGKREGEQPKPEKKLNNNIVLRKLKIALNYKDTDMLDTLKLAGLRVGKPELSALFRKPGHKQYRLCKDQFLRNFLMGLQLKLRPEGPESKGKSKGIQFTRKTDLPK